MNESEIMKIKKFRNMKTLVAHIVDRCLQYWNNDSMIEFIDVLESQARFLPSYVMSRSWR